MTPASLSSAYAREVADLLTLGPNATRPVNAHPLLSEREGEEMVEDFLHQVPAKTFAAKLEKRDLADFEQSIDHVNTEANSYGLRCLVCGEFVAACRCDGIE